MISRMVGMCLIVRCAGRVPGGGARRRVPGQRVQRAAGPARLLQDVARSVRLCRTRHSAAHNYLPLARSPLTPGVCFASRFLL